MKIMSNKKLAIRVKALSKYNDRGRAAAKQINRLRDAKTDKHLGRNHTKERKIHTNRCTSSLTVDSRTQRVKQKNKKNEVLYVLLLLK